MVYVIGTLCILVARSISHTSGTSV